jgi:hypothetical protein
MNIAVRQDIDTEAAQTSIFDNRILAIRMNVLHLHYLRYSRLLKVLEL